MKSVDEKIILRALKELYDELVKFSPHINLYYEYL